MVLEASPPSTADDEEVNEDGQTEVHACRQLNLYDACMSGNIPLLVTWLGYLLAYYNSVNNFCRLNNTVI